MAQANKTGKPISTEILDFLEWFSAETPNEYEKGIETGLRIAQTIAEIVERRGEEDWKMADIIHKPTKSEFKRMAVQLGYTRLRELAEADRDGRVVVKPCKVGDTLFRVFAGEILEHKVRNMRYLAIQGRWDIDTTPFCSYAESSIGKTIFLTREEAKDHRRAQLQRGI